MKKLHLLPLVLTAGMPVIASAAVVVVQPNSITYTGTNPNAGIAGIINPNGLINGTGLSAALTVENIATVTHNNPFAQADNTWATNDPNGGFGNDFFAAEGAQGTVVFELVFDATYEFDKFYSWSYDFDEPRPNANNFKTITLDFGIGDFNGGTVPGIEFTAPANNLPSVASLGGVSADRLRVTVTDNWFDDNSVYQGGDRVASAEFAFTTIPEPTSAALLGLGALAMGLCRRR
jgi:hypothetical protein